VLDVQSDATHNRSVLTLAGDADALRIAVPVLFARAVDAIDLRTHSGAHPRLGAVDVVPFIPIEGATMADCVALARAVAEDVATRQSVPVYLYEEAATGPHRRSLEDIRRGEFEGLADKMTRLGAGLRPAAPHRRGSRSARACLVAYNINRLTVWTWREDRHRGAQATAGSIREGDGIRSTTEHRPGR
jgi:glutamate formiminotransferase